MSIKCNKETIEYRGVTASFSAQSAVECRFPGNIATVLAVSATVVPAACSVENGEVEYRGRLLLTVVYEDGDKNVCRTERGMEFTHRAEHEACTPASSAAVTLFAEKVSARREGSGVYVTVTVGADITLTAQKSYDYLSGGEGFVFRREEAEAVRPLLSEGEIEAEDEFDTEYVGDLLLHGEGVSVTSVSSGEGVLTAAGEISLSVCALKADGTLVSYERLIPFRGEVECDGATPMLKCDASAFVKSVSVTADTDEEKGVCRIRFEAVLSVRATAYERMAFNPVTDAFSCTNRLSLERATLSEEYLFDTVRFTERVSGTAFVGGSGGGITFADALQAVVLASAAAESVKSDGKELAEGALTAKVIVADGENAHRSVDVTLPFSVPLRLDEDGRRAIEVLPCAVVARQRKEGEIEIEATLRLCVKIYKIKSAECVCSVAEGEAVEEKKCAFSVYMASAGEDLWQTAKRLNKSPQDIECCNPSLHFPLDGTERIIVYRKG